MNTIDLRNVNILSIGIVDPQSSGLSIILDIFYECAKRDGVAGMIDNVFIEYSTISSMLVDSKMLGYACLGEGADATFGVNVVRYAEPIIKHVQDNKISLYHHKDFISARKDGSFHKAGHKFISSVCFGNNNKKREVIEKYSIDSINVKGNEISEKNKYWAISYNIEYKDFISLIDKYPKERNNENLEDFFAVIHILYDKYFWPNNLPKDTNSVFFGIPTIGAIVEGNNIIGQGGIFIYFTYSCNDNKIKEFIDNISVELDYAVKSITLNVLANAGLVLAQKVSKESIRSAISAIMARNMSHNLGSHFISNTKHYFSNLAENDEDEQRQKDYRGIRHTLQYIQERMDFIATIVSTDRFPYGPVNVKSQIFDELTPDEFGGRHEKATTNFLLDYIVFSEDISKQSNPSKSSIKLSLKLISDNGKEFGGQDIENQAAKEVFAKLNLAVPGGILGRHAIFTIIENVIRNSAKHDKENIPKDGLNVSIKIGKGYIIIFDNKKNAKKKIKDDFLIDELQKRYTDIKILSDGAIDKSNKGLKEILISALWLNNYSLADWFGEYENTSTEDKITKLSEVLKIVTVEDNGDITDDGENLGYYIALDKYEEVYHIEGNRVKIVEGDKIYYSSISGIKADIIAANRDYEVLIDENLGQNGDASTDSNNILRLSDLYPRFFENKDKKELPQTEEMMKAIIARNTRMKFEDLEGIDIHIEPKDYNILADKSKKNHCIWHAKGEASGIKKNDILYKNHLSTLKTEEIDRVIAAYEDAAYIDSISGGDFTGTITQSFFLENEFNRLKVIESALTEFVIIDERVFKNYGHGFKPLDGDVKLESNKSILEAEKIFNEVEDLLCLEKSVDDIADSIYNRYDIVLNVSLLNGDNKEQIRKDIDIKIAKKKSKAATEAEKTENNSDNISALHKIIEKRKLHIYDIDKNGNILNLKGKSIANVIKFNDMDKLCSPTFLSIHLSIIEKITKENGVAASQVMANLKKLFGNTKFVTIHSGRGNLSAELEKELRDYAFLSLSAIQAAMDDSKYFLSQLLYNNCYIGKGRLNHK